MPANKVATVGIVGAGSMGGAMALLFSEKGDQIVMYDTTKSSVDKVLENAKKAQIDLLVADSYADLVSRFDVPANGPRIIVFSLPHGAPVDTVLNALLPHLAPGDVILDGGNEWYEETERRQGKALAKGVHYVGCGVSGGYQSARRGPSMSPGCSPEAYEIVESRLKKWAAKDRSGKPCVDLMGPGGSGHYVKMLHNGIEQGHLSVLAEAHHLLHFVAGLSNDEVADIWDEWNGTRELEEDYANAKMGGEGKELMDNFLVKIGANIMRFKKGAGMDLEKGIVDGIEDKVTQDIDNSEGTGVWSVRELAARHIPAPTIAAAHQLRLTSGPRGARQIVAKELKLPQPTQLKGKDGFDVKAFVEDVRLAVYAGILGAYIQGMNIIAEADKEEGWRLNYAKIISIWRSGCIIKSTAISDLIQPLFEKDPDNHHLLEHPEVAAELKKTYAALKRVCVIGIQTDSTIPSLDATLGWMKSLGAEELPTNFEEAELDYFGHHNFDKRTENAPDPVKGKNHVEWAPA